MSASDFLDKYDPAIKKEDKGTKTASSFLDQYDKKTALPKPAEPAAGMDASSFLDQYDPIAKAADTRGYEDPAREEARPEGSEGFLGGVADFGRGLVGGAASAPEMIGEAANFFQRQTSLEAGEDPTAGTGLIDTTKVAEEAMPWAQESKAGKAEGDEALSLRGQAYESGEAVAHSMGGAAAGAVAGGAIGSIIPGIGTILGATIGAGVGFFAPIPIFSGQQGEETYKRAFEHGKKQGLSEEEAHSEAIKAGNINAAIEGGGELLGNIVTAGLSRVIPRNLKKGLVKSLMDNKGAPWQGVKDIATKVIPTELGTEMGQALGQAKVEEIYAGGEGMSPEVAKQVIIPTIIMSVLTGTGAATIGGIRRAELAHVLSDTEQDPEVRAQAAERVGQLLDKQDPEIAQMWREAAAANIKDGQPVVPEEDAFYREFSKQEHDNEATTDDEPPQAGKPDEAAQVAPEPEAATDKYTTEEVEYEVEHYYDEAGNVTDEEGNILNDEQIAKVEAEYLAQQEEAPQPVKEAPAEKAEETRPPIKKQPRQIMPDRDAGTEIIGENHYTYNGFEIQKKDDGLWHVNQKGKKPTWKYATAEEALNTADALNGTKGERPGKVKKKEKGTIVPPENKHIVSKLRKAIGEATDPEIKATLQKELDSKLTTPKQEQMKAARQVDLDKDDLLTFIKKKGGLDVRTETAGNGSDFAGRLKTSDKRVFGLPGIEQSGGKGLSIADLTELAHDAGFIKERDERELYNKLDQISRGETVTSEQNQVDYDEIERKYREQQELDALEEPIRTFEDIETEQDELKSAENEARKYAESPEQIEAVNEAFYPQEKEEAAAVVDNQGRRGDPAVRKALDQFTDEMSPEELRNAVRTHELTGIKNLRAYAEDIAERPGGKSKNKKQTQISLDVDGLGWVNDNMGGHEAGDTMLRTVADALASVTDLVYHKSGDEFIVQANNPVHAKQLISKARKILDKSTITAIVVDSNGIETKVTLPSIQFSNGIGKTYEEADAKLKSDKEARQAAGSRVAKGDEPTGVLREGAVDRQDQRRTDTDQGLDLLGDDTRTAQALADREKELDDKRNGGGKDVPFVQGGDELGADGGKLEADMFTEHELDVIEKKENGIVDIDTQAHEAATSNINDKDLPTEEQIEGDNYEKGHPVINGVQVSIENPAGSKRRAEWPALKDHYGDIKRTQGAEGEKNEGVDVFINAEIADKEIESRQVFVVDQYNKDGSFDEHKVVLGAKNSVDAKRIYKRNYSKDWKGGGKVTKFNWDEFKEWVFNENNTKKPASTKEAIPEDKALNDLLGKKETTNLTPDGRAYAEATVYNRLPDDYKSQPGDETYPSAMKEGKKGGAESVPMSQWSDQELVDKLGINTVAANNAGKNTSQAALDKKMPPAVEQEAAASETAEAADTEIKFEGHKLYPLAVSKKFTNILAKALKNAGVDNTHNDITIHFRDPDYSHKTGGYHPVEVSITPQGTINYITDYTYYGPDNELGKDLDFDFSNKLFFQEAANFFSQSRGGPPIGDLPIKSGKGLYRTWQSNFTSYYDSGVFDVEVFTDKVESITKKSTGTTITYDTQENGPQARPDPAIEQIPVEEVAAEEQDIVDPYLKFDNKEITYEAEIEDTGETLTVKIDSGTVIRDTHKRIETLKSLLRCIA